MKRILMIVAILTLFSACRPQEGDITNADAVGPASVTENGETSGETSLAGRPGDAFQTSLPQGVVLRQPHHARMDMEVTTLGGSIGRRTEFEYLDGDAVQAMSRFSASMVAAGFSSSEGPLVEQGVVRQVFKKPGYGAVFARAQEDEPAKRKHTLARGFVVVAWPAGPASLN